MENKIYKLISKYDNIVIARHVGPDPDAVASEIALRDSIKLTFPKKKVYAVGASVSRFKSYGHLDKIDASTLENPLLIVLDVPNIYRIDGVDFNIFKEVIKIDHHPYEDKMGKVEIVDTTVASACEIVARIIFKTKLKMDKSIASNLFLGMVADSDRFLLPTTSKSTFDTASKLVNDYKIDYIIDACDTIMVKKELIKYTYLNKIGFIASMGTGNKLEPSKLEITTLDKTSYDPIAKILRKYVKDEKINKKVYVVCSKEQPKKINEKTISSISTVPSTAGLLLSSFVINSIINN